MEDQDKLERTILAGFAMHALLQRETGHLYLSKLADLAELAWEIADTMQANDPEELE